MDAALDWLEFGVGAGAGAGVGAGAGAGEAVRRIMTAINTNEKTKITIKMKQIRINETLSFCKQNKSKSQ